jgi:hypothetical protein
MHQLAPSFVSGWDNPQARLRTPQRSAHCDALSRPSPSAREPISARGGEPIGGRIRWVQPGEAGCSSLRAALSATY